MNNDKNDKNENKGSREYNTNKTTLKEDDKHHH